jgi:hypothetical protein
MSFSAAESGQIFSQDARGRLLIPLERREALLAEYDRSGMGRVKFAQYVGIKYSTLAYWLKRRRELRRREKRVFVIFGSRSLHLNPTWDEARHRSPSLSSASA